MVFPLPAIGSHRFDSLEAAGRKALFKPANMGTIGRLCVPILGRDNRAHYGQSKLKSRLCSIGQFDPDQWDFPPKPKWIRWKTYNRYAHIIRRRTGSLTPVNTPQGLLHFVQPVRGVGGRFGGKAELKGKRALKSNRRHP